MTGLVVKPISIVNVLRAEYLTSVCLCVFQKQQVVQIDKTFSIPKLNDVMRTCWARKEYGESGNDHVDGEDPDTQPVYHHGSELPVIDLLFRLIVLFDFVRDEPKFV